MKKKKKRKKIRKKKPGKFSQKRNCCKIIKIILPLLKMSVDRKTASFRTEISIRESGGIWDRDLWEPPASFQIPKS